MLTEIDRHATETGRHAPEPAPDPVVAVLGQPSRVASLPHYLPHGWTMRTIPGLDAARPGDLVVLSGATIAVVRQARAALPAETRVIALIDDWAPGELVAGVLSAGADVCVRGGHPAILAGHLVACRRRQLTDRWAEIKI
ncbi:hypothetical protein [Actinoplanes aureus]|uniref:Uncharacterized protein n=1 Tax=Actinoplanes aureus TaxID=2792083 RepID=A0A931C6I8_9ACTN|nr:hypothetical protein [Actinoplanes aureus]MBG0562292.1 hypothetical protein [Actinoplanes aureus]